MDRLEAMRVFVAALDQGSLAAAGRKLRRSPAAVTRAIAALEAHVGVKLMHRTTRALTLTEAGERYAASCRRVLNDLDEADLQAAGERSAPRGVLTVTAPLIAGARILRPIVDDFLDTQPAVQVRLLLLDRVVNLVDEGIDAALRIAHLPDSSQVAVKVGAVRWVVCASPGYLARGKPIKEPGDLTGHNAIALGQLLHGDVWTFHGKDSKPRSVRVASRLSVNTIDAALGSAIEGHGVARALSYQVHEELRGGRLKRLLQDFEPPPQPVHIVVPEGRLAVAKVRAFVDFAVPKLKAAFTASA